MMQNIPQKGRGLGHVSPKIFGVQSNMSSKLHKAWILCCFGCVTSSLLHGVVNW